MTTDANAPTQLIRIDEVERLTGVRKSFIYREVRNGAFPAPIKVGLRASRWDSKEIETWIRSQIAASSARRR